MAVERTISIIKPDAVGKNVIGQIYDRFEKAGLQIVAAKMVQLSQQLQTWEQFVVTTQLIHILMLPTKIVRYET